MKTRAAAGPAPHGLPPAAKAADELRLRLLAFLSARHPGRSELLYHNLEHSLEVADLAARCVGALTPAVPIGRRALIALAAALHDVDPERRAGTPPRVAATVEYLATDHAALRLIADFGARFGFDRRQVSALILATGHDPDPERMSAQRARFLAAARAAFPDEPEAADWGRALGYWDKAATYVSSPEVARRRVAGLARELREAAGGRGPSTEAAAAESARFVSALRRDPLFTTLPLEDRVRFEATLAALAADAESMRH